jgi:TonB family protein
VGVQRHDMTQLGARVALAAPQVGPANQQTVRLLAALTLLLIALVAVIVKDRDFWFASDEAFVSTPASSENVTKTNSVAAPAKTVSAPVARPSTVKNHIAAKPSTVAENDASRKDVATQDSPVVATRRVVLPPLDVEVVAGDTHRTVHPGSNVTKVEIPSDANRGLAIATSANMPTNAAEQERLTSASVPELRQTVETYPLLGQHSKVQGSVVLQAVVGADGTIEDLQVLSGPAILATAAQQAVRQWRFKPYLQNGLPVETKTRITVNFSIKVSDNAKTS